MSLRLKGTAAFISSGSSSEAKVVPPPANESPTLLTAMRLTEQPEPIMARPTIISTTILFIAPTDVSSPFRPGIMPA